MDKSVEIKRVVIKVGNNEISFTLDEAKELKEILNKTFGETIQPHYNIVPYYVPYCPPYHSYPSWKIMYGTGTNPGVMYCTTTASNQTSLNTDTGRSSK